MRQKKYVVLSYYLGCGSEPDFVFETDLLWLAGLKRFLLSWPHRNDKTIYRQRFEVVNRSLYLYCKDQEEE